MEFIVVRHGEAEHHVGDMTGGWTDSGLTERGIGQAESTARRLVPLVGKDVVFLSSDQRRAQETAEIIGVAVNAEPRYCIELREFNNGDAANETKAKAEMLSRPVTEPVWDWIPYPNAESWRQMRRRIWDFLGNLIEPDGKYLILSHGNAIVEIINWFLKINGENHPISYDVEACSITMLRENRWNERTIHKLNDTSHLS